MQNYKILSAVFWNLTSQPHLIKVVSPNSIKILSVPQNPEIPVWSHLPNPTSNNKHKPLTDLTSPACFRCGGPSPISAHQRVFRCGGPSPISPHQRVFRCGSLSPISPHQRVFVKRRPCRCRFVWGAFRQRRKGRSIGCRGKRGVGGWRERSI